MEDSARNIFSSILNGDALKDPAQLLQFVLLTFADLKAYKFTYWLGVPALLPDRAFESTELTVLKNRDSELVGAVYQAMKLNINSSTLPYVFAIYHPSTETTNGELPFVVDQVLTLEQAWSHCFHKDIYFVVPDSSSDENSFGWAVRNFLAMLSIVTAVSRGGVQESVSGSVRVIGLRGVIAKRMSAVR